MLYMPLTPCHFTLSAECTNTNALDNMLVGLIGDNPASIILVAFSQGFLTVNIIISTLNITTLQGMTHHRAVPHRFHSGPYVDTG
jgi:hypothetical protein